MDEQAKINKDTAIKLKAIDKVLESINSKVMGWKLQPSSGQHDEDVRDTSGTTCRVPIR
jgi:hypothetical protein